MRLPPSVVRGVVAFGPVLAIMIAVGGCGGGTTTTTTTPKAIAPDAPDTPTPGPAPKPGPDTTPEPTRAPTKDPGCRPDQAQCDTCHAGACVTCKTNYKLNGDKKCVAECIGSTPPTVPSKPSDPFQLNGKPWPALCINKTSAHFFGIGDWGGDKPGGRAWTNPGKCVGASLSGNETVGMPFRTCTEEDHWAQKNVAGQMIQRVPKSDPDYILNAGDNFYPGGYNRVCGDHSVADTSHQFAGMWEQVYTWDKFADRPWLSVLGNHDYGGRGHNQGWDLQIYFTWSGKPWVMPAQYWSRLVQYQDFAIQYYFLDSNFIDANVDYNHKICQGGGNCYGFDDANCITELFKVWAEGVTMIENIMKDSTAEWHIVVSHYTGDSLANQPNLMRVHEKYHIDLLFTGHQHDQKMGNTKGLEWIISGGGGGVTTDTGPGKTEAGYGFIDFEINRTHMIAHNLNWNGYEVQSKVYTAKPRNISREIVV